MPKKRSGRRTFVLPGLSRRERFVRHNRRNRYAHDTHSPDPTSPPPTLYASVDGTREGPSREPGDEQYRFRDDANRPLLSVPLPKNEDVNVNVERKCRRKNCTGFSGLLGQSFI